MGIGDLAQSPIPYIKNLDDLEKMRNDEFIGNVKIL